MNYVRYNDTIMILKHVFLQNFRNYVKYEVGIHEQLTIVVGPNARGKTNLLESIYMGVNGVGFRETKEEELLRWDEESGLIETKWNDNGSEFLFQILLHKSVDKLTKKYHVNKTTKTHHAYSNYQTRAVLFAPEQIELITGSPDKRREYVNIVIGMHDHEYKKKVQNYEQALRKRNKVLEYHSDIHRLKEELIFWNTYLLEQAIYIQKKREEYVCFLLEHKFIDNRSFEIGYVKNEFSEARLEEKFDLETKVRRTLIGPQKDDFIVRMVTEKEKKSMHVYGSRSEQRLAVVWLKLNEIFLIESELKKRPILLLDDVFSELDTNNKNLVLKLVKDYQTVLTTTEEQLSEVTGLPQEVVKI